MLSNVIRHHRAKSERPEDRDGFTLIEVITAIVLLGIIMVPLTAAFIQGIRRSTDVEQRLTRSANQERITSWWTKDVNNVDPQGVNDPDATCPDPTSIPGTETALVSFSWDTQTGPNVAPKSASWVLEDAGPSAKLVRRYCEGGAPVAEATIAEGFGKAGLTSLQLVYGTTVGQANFCTSTRCTLSVGGDYPYALTADRRVLGSAAIDSAPPPPDITDCQKGASSVLVSWNPSILTATQSEVSAYQASIFTTSADGATPAASITVDGSSTSAEVPATNGVAYWVRVKAENAIGYGDYSVACGSVTPDVTPPGAPTNVTGTPAPGTALVDWDDPANTGGLPIVSYIVYVNDGTTDTEYPTSNKPFQLPDGILENGKPYTLAVRAINGSGPGPKSAYSAPVYPYGPVLTMVDFDANVRSDRSILVFWSAVLPPTAPVCVTPPSDPGDAAQATKVCISNGSPVTEYRIDLAKEVGSGYELVPGYPQFVPQPALGSNPSPYSQVAHATPPLEAGETYVVGITPRNAAGDGQLVSPVPLPIPAEPPGAIGLPDIVATATANEVAFVIPAPSSDGGSPITRYEIEAPSGRSATVTPAGAETIFYWNSTTASGPILLNFTPYAFTIRACNAAGCGPWSPPYESMPIPTPQVANVSVLNTGLGQGTIAFDYLPGTGTGYVASPYRQTGYNAGCINYTELGWAANERISVSNSGMAFGAGECGVILVNRGTTIVDGAPQTESVAGPYITYPVEIYDRAGTMAAPTLAKGPGASAPFTSITVTAGSTPSSGGSDPGIQYRAFCRIGTGSPTASAAWSTSSSQTVSGLTSGQTYNCYMRARPTARAQAWAEGDNSPTTTITLS